MTPTATPNRWVEFALLGLLAGLWGSSYLFIGIAIDSIPPLTLIATRVSIAAIFLGVVLRALGDQLPRDRATWRLLGIQSCLSAIGPWTLLAWGQQFIASGLAAVLNSTSPMFVFFITLLLTRHEATSGLKLFGACLGVAGVTLIVGTDVLAGVGEQVVAQLAVLLSALLYGAAAIHGARFRNISPTATAAGTMICASACLLPLSLIVDRPWTLDPPAEALGAAFGLGFFCTGVALLIYFRLIRTLGSMGVASQSYLRAGVGVGLGIVILGETITPVVGVGLAATILGVIAINARRSPG